MKILNKKLARKSKLAKLEKAQKFLGKIIKRKQQTQDLVKQVFNDLEQNTVNQVAKDIKTQVKNALTNNTSCTNQYIKKANLEDAQSRGYKAFDNGRIYPPITPEMVKEFEPAFEWQDKELKIKELEEIVDSGLCKSFFCYDKILLRCQGELTHTGRHYCRIATANADQTSIKEHLVQWDIGYSKTSEVVPISENKFSFSRNSDFEGFVVSPSESKKEAQEEIKSRCMSSKKIS